MSDQDNDNGNPAGTDPKSLKEAADAILAADAAARKGDAGEGDPAGDPIGERDPFEVLTALQKENEELN